MHNTFCGHRLGLKPGETDGHRLADLVRAIVADDQPRLRRFREWSDEIEARTGQQRLGPQTYLVPGEALMTRDMNVSGTSGSQYLVGTETIGYSNALAKRSIISRLPLQQHVELRPNVEIVRTVAQHSVGWLASEGVTEISDGQGTTGLSSMAPKTVAATVALSRQMVLQGGTAGSDFITGALASSSAQAVDAGLINGSGALGQPQGLLTMSGIDSRAGTSIALSDVAAMLEIAEGYAADDSVVWVMGTGSAEILRQREKAAGSGMLMSDMTLLGRLVIVSRSAPANALVVTPWSHCHFAQWGSLEVGVDGYTNFATGRVVIRALWRVDFVVDEPGQVAVATALT